MPDGARAGERKQSLTVEDVRHVAHPLVMVEFDPIGGHDTGGFLAPVLQPVQAEVGQA